MVTRIASFAHSKVLLAQLMRVQVQASQSEIRASTGRKAEEYQGYGADASRLVAAKSYLENTQQGIDTATQLKTTVDAQQVSLDRVRSLVQRMTKAIQDGVSGGTSTGIMGTLDAGLSGIVAALNTSQNGMHLFGGTRSNAAPVVSAAATPAGLLGLSSAIAAFDQGGRRLTATIAGSGSVTYGQTALNVGRTTLEVLRNIYQYNAGTFTGAGGPGTALNGPLTPAQTDFLTGQMAQLLQADTALVDYSVQGGIVQNRLSDVISRLGAQKTMAAKIVSDIQDIDVATAATKLNEDRSAVEVATKVLGSVNKSSLLDYI
jgi:flagellar hook-associated protein 3 FlgL